jgi:aspartyl-tRNA(Asn)/glutamyl-tRNA(Gln) amidotransferase subunit C
MAVDKATVAHIAKLARIRIDEAQKEALSHELSNILTWIEQLSELDTDDVEPMTSVVAMQIPLREDEVTDGERREDILANAPEPADGFFIVPKVVEG